MSTLYRSKSKSQLDRHRGTNQEKNQASGMPTRMVRMVQVVRVERLVRVVRVERLVRVVPLFERNGAIIYTGFESRSDL